MEVSPDKIIEITADYFNTTIELVKGRSRKGKTPIYRHAAMKMLREHTLLSLNKIGSYFNDRDHSSVISSIQHIEDLEGYDVKFKKQLLILRDKIK